MTLERYLRLPTEFSHWRVPYKVQGFESSKFAFSGFLSRTLKFWLRRSVFVVGCYRGLCAVSMGTEIEVIRLLVRKLWFFVFFVLRKLRIVTCILDFGFSFDHYKTQDSGLLVYEDSKRLNGRSTYDYYFTRNRNSKKLKNAILCDYSYNQTFP